MPVVAVPLDEDVVKVTGGSAPQAIAGALDVRLMEGRVPVLRAIGAGPCLQATKAIAIVRSYTAQRGLDLGFTVGFQTLYQRDDPTLDRAEVQALVWRFFFR